MIGDLLWLLHEFLMLHHVIVLLLNLFFLFLACSDFVDIFDVNWFISSLAKDVTIVKRVPDKVMRSMEKPPYTMRVPRKSAPEYYLDQVLPILLRRRVSLLCHLPLNFFLCNHQYYKLKHLCLKLINIHA